ncbi:hypothetical protein CRUP_030783, partial [Coryphaenoides rupestris]
PPPSSPVSDLAPGQLGLDDMKMLEQKAQQANPDEIDIDGDDEGGEENGG